MLTDTLLSVSFFYFQFICEVEPKILFGKSNGWHPSVWEASEIKLWAGI